MTDAWKEVAETLTAGRIDALMRTDLPGDFRLSDQEDAYRDIARDARAAAQLTKQRAWEQVGINPGSAEQQGQALLKLFERIDQFELSAASPANPTQERQQIVDALAAGRGWLMKSARPYRRPDGDVADNYLDRFQANLTETERLADEARQALESIRSRAANTGAVSAAALYKDQAIREDRSAQQAAWALIGCMLAFAGSALLLFVVFRLDSSAQVVDAIFAVAGRAVVLAVGVYAISFFARNFRAHRHLAAVNRFKANALEATPLLREGIATDDQRDVIVAELVRAVFAVPDTGFIDGTSDSVTVQAPLSTALGMAIGRPTSTN